MTSVLTYEKVLPLLTSPRLRRLCVAAALTSLIFTFLLTLDRSDLVHSHEARAAQNAQRILETGEWGLPRLFDGRLELQKPPAYYWCVAWISRWLNSGQVTTWTTRLPAALMGIACVAGVYAFLRILGHDGAARLAAIVLASAIHFTALSRIARIDVPLTAAVSFSIFGFFLGCKNHYLGNGFHSMLWHFLAGLSAGIALLLKGPVGIALIVCAAGSWWLIEHRRLSWLGFFILITTAACVGLPWFVWANQATNGELFRVFILHHNIARFNGTSPQLATHPWWFYIPRFTFDFLPWSPLFFFGIYYACKNNIWKTDYILRFSLICFLSMLTLLSISNFKRADYLLPAYPFAAIFMGCILQNWRNNQNVKICNCLKQLFHILWIVTLIGWFIMVAVTKTSTSAQSEQSRFAERVRQIAPAPINIIQFRMEDHLLSFRLGQPLETLVEWQDLHHKITSDNRQRYIYIIMPKDYVYPAIQILSDIKWKILSQSEIINNKIYILLSANQ
jgi:4-amino-4-deoxy-L-arabinose transferase-like glycosyltransferase